MQSLVARGEYCPQCTDFAQRYGSDGEDRTLEAIGMRFGVTRERVRQICAKMLGRFSGGRFATPVIDQLIADIQPLLPATF
ncbi:sigma factor-like helix-turn-helix DNA-binding protein [Thauera sp. 27]|uniref:sigma factor-like helix-turn-helix DNA-binding protein n=1 Tax=Thauera sp. 27 TaxID=305700 RepID=UPI00056BE3A5